MFDYNVRIRYVLYEANANMQGLGVAHKQN